MAETEEKWEYPSLEWIHRVREAQYQKTKDFPVESRLKAVDPQQALRACTRLGLKVRIRQADTRERETTPR